MSRRQVLPVQTSAMLTWLPDWLRPVVYCSPLWHGVELARAATTGTVDAPAAAGHVAVLAAMIVVGSVFGVRAVTRRLAS